MRKFNWDYFFLAFTICIALCSTLAAAIVGVVCETLHALWFLLLTTLSVSFAVGRWG